MAQFVDILYPKAYGFHDIRILSSCQDELRNIIEDSDKRAKLRSDYEARLSALSKHKRDAHRIYTTWFEQLKHVGPYYSILFKGHDNLRILYTVQDDLVYLLCAFREREDGYKHYMDIAKSRAKLI